MTLCEASQTPSSNTGSKCQNNPVTLSDLPEGITLQPSIDYFQGTTTFPNLERLHQFTDYLGQMGRDYWLYMPGRPFSSGMSWANSAESVKGCRLGYQQDEVTGVWRCWVSLPGRFWHHPSLRDSWRILTGLACAFRFKCTRIDLKVRDFARRVSPITCAALAISGDVARIKRWEVSGSGDVGCGAGSVGGGSIAGISSGGFFTCYLGSRSSEKFLRIYDAMPVHKVDAIDFEVQFRDDKAQSAFKQLSSYQSSLENPLADNDIAQAIAAFVVGSVDFVHRDGQRLSRCERYSWWQSMIDEIGGFLLCSIERDKPTLTTVKNWLHRQVYPTLAVFSHLLKSQAFRSYLDSRLAEAKCRWGKRHELLLQAGMMDVELGFLLQENYE